MPKKRADGLMQRLFRYEGKQYIVYGHSLAELSSKEAQKRAELKAGYDKRKNPTMQQYFESWIERKRPSVTEATIRRHTHMFKSISDINIDNVKRKFGDLKIKDVTLDDISYIQKELAKTHKTRGVNDTIALLKCMLKDAVNMRIIDYNPAVMVQPLKRTEPQARNTIHRALDPEEQKRFFESQAVKDSYYYDVFRLALLSGMRIGEIGALKNSDIHNGFIHVERTITRTETGGYIVGETAKTEAGKRKIPYTDDIKAVIKHQKEINNMLDNGVPNIDDLIFKTQRRGIIISWGINKEIKRLCALLQMEPFTIHGLRATFCTRMIEAGVEPKTLQELMGHADIGVTLNIYAHAQDNKKIDAMNRVHIAI